MSRRLGARALLPWFSIFSFIAFGCASGDDGTGDGDAGTGAMDSGRADSGNGGGGDAGEPDAGSDAGDIHGDGLVCETCETEADCAENHFCVPLMTGGRVCMLACDLEIPTCPPRFECVRDATAEVPDPFCAPLGERCCVDADEDIHGSGVGCLGTDCNDDDPETNSSASELCDGEDNDCNGTPDDGDPDALCVRADHVATTVCAAGACEIVACEPLFADCNMMSSDGCEISTGTAVDCGTCGAPCDPANATGDCSGGTCRVGSCDPGWGDCNMSALDGCEVRLNTLTDCGACGNGCSLPHASTTCGSGTCEIAACSAGWGNCDTITATGCETSTRTNADCGSCGSICSPLHGTGECSTGSCEIVGCDPGWGDCNFDSLSCETSLRTTSNCGSCGTGCTRPNASTSCSTGSCSFVSCNSNFSNCDGDTGDGCEVNHRAVVGSCGDLTYDLGSWDGDMSCGTGFLGACEGNPFDGSPFQSRTGTSSAWFTANLNEDSSCGANLQHRIDLEVPDGVDYDLYIYFGCGSSATYSGTGGTGADESLVIERPDSDFSWDDYRYYIEVRQYSGASCSPWTLRVYGRDC